MKRLIILLTLSFALPFIIKAQDLTDALRYSKYQITGTARSGGMGNAFGALGGDFTSVGINPAGLGIYQSSEFVFTPMFGRTEVEASYMGNLATDSKYNFQFNNLSYVAVIPSQKSTGTGLININFGIGYNRLMDFNSVSNVLGHGVESSFLDNLIENANGEDPNQGWSEFYEGLAYYDANEEYGADLIYEEDGFWQSDIQQNPTSETVNNYLHSQRKSITREGAINEYSLALGLNLNHKFYVGASLGIVDLNYIETSIFKEWDRENIIPRFNEMQFEKYLHATGTGYNGKLGFIFKPVNEVRLGASVSTPTFYNIHETFDTYMYSNNTFEENQDPVEDEAYSRINEYDFDVETPLKATLSGAIVIAKNGLISVDYEYVDYGSMRLRRGGDRYDFMAENDEIAEAFHSVGNIRAGGELRVTPTVSLRAGYELYPSPLNTNIQGKTRPDDGVDLNVYTAGIGFKSGGFFLDMAFRHAFQKEFEFLYEAPATATYPAPEFASFNTVKNNVMLTVGFRF